MRSNKTVILFLVKFFGTYALLFLVYSYYLEKTQQKEPDFVCAPITTKVAEQTGYVLQFFGYDAEIEQNKDEASIKLMVNDKYVANVIEGCNSLSILILFISFIVAFAGKFKTTVLYILFGSLLIYSLNIIRIAFISVALFKYPEYQHFLHDILFPAIIYGVTVMLWFIWVKKFSKVKR